MESFKKVLRGAFITSTAVCLLSFGVAAQDQTTSPQGSTGADQHATHGKTHKGSTSKAASSSETSSSAGAASGSLSAADKKFVMKAAEGGLTEVQLGQLAAQKGQSDDVKKFGQRMVDDHGKANDQLKQLAEQKGVTLPTEPSAKDKAEADRLSKLSGDQFDKAYMRHMVMDHKKDVAEFKKESTTAKDSDVKNFATQTLPTLEDHLKQAEQVAGSTGAKTGMEHKSKAKTASATTPNPK
ncbi:MAG TPA: DUF4142 domain-containing protein [Terriglobales bacterium]|nr:DUF4142 domain-containing protein [Terriglobales bacterium]